MLKGVDGFSTSGLMQQLQKSENSKKDSAIQDKNAIDKKTEISEQVNNGEYKVNTEATSKKMALYLLYKE